MPETLTAPPLIASMPVSFKGLRSYEEEDADFFFGRSQEIEALYQLINVNVLTIVFGKSGTGKTSLLNAGVFPKLREDNCLPFRIRLEFQDDKPPLMEQIRKVLQEQIDKYGFKVESIDDSVTLWEFFHRESLWKVITPVLIFDQFEEIFTLAYKNPVKKKEIDYLIRELSDLIENTIPQKVKAKYFNSNEKIEFNYKKQKAKIIFAFREDFLPEMESITANIPSVRNSRFRLLPMTGIQANEVITRTWDDRIDAAEAKKIVYYLTNETETESVDSEYSFGKFELLEIEPSLLSQVCTYLERERQREGLNKISAAFLDKYPKAIILRSIYHQALKESSLAGNGVQPEEEESSLQVFVEEHLVTEEGYRTKFELEKIPVALEPGIGNLKRRYFLREEGKSIEVTHDVIATIVKSDRDERRTLLAIKEANRRARRKAIIIIAIAAIIGAAALAYFLLKANDARIENNEIKEQIKKNADSLKHILEDIEKSKDVTPSPARQVIYDTVAIDDRIEALEFARYGDSMNMVRLDLENRRLRDELSTHKDSVVSSIIHINNISRELSNLRTDDRNRKEYFRMYQSHLDSIIRFNDDSGKLQYHIQLIRQHKDAFSKKLQ